MNSQPDIRVTLAILVAIGSSGCTLLFSETSSNAANDAGPAADANPQALDAAPDASPNSCGPHTCSGASVHEVLFHFDDGDLLTDECGNSELVNEIMIGSAQSQAELDRAATIVAGSKADALLAVHLGSWTVDFWLRLPPVPVNGQLLSLSKQAALISGNCGLKLAIGGGVLQLVESRGAANNSISTFSLNVQQWNHISLVYDHTLGSETAALTINGGNPAEATIPACTETATILSIGNWDSAADNLGTTAQIDELRYQNAAVIAKPCGD
jgi:hypothetical protein